MSLITHNPVLLNEAIKSLNIRNNFTNLTEIKFIRKISTGTIKDLKRTYYLFEGKVK